MGFGPKHRMQKLFGRLSHWSLYVFQVLPGARDIIDIDGVSADNCLIAPFPQSIFLSKLAFSY